MGAIYLPQRTRAIQPQGPVTLAGEFQRYGVYAAISSLSLELLSSRSLLGPTIGYNRYGKTLTAGDFTLAPAADGFWPVGSQATILMQAFNIATTAGQPTIGTSTGTTANANIYLPFSTDGKVYWRWGLGESEGTSSISVPSLSFADGDWFAFTVGSRGMEVWQNGKLAGSNTGSPTRAAGGLTAPKLRGGTTSTYKFSMLATLSTQLPQAFLRRNDYWSLFAPLPSRVYSFPNSSFNAAWAGRSVVIGAGVY